ncbi:hypothetical protein ABZ540_12740 [Nocardia xishanensis]|uniref:hypothetical protein n=1 Tax=Nocardia xishanensis TaxID=238964 RepID=UPI0033E49E71
MTTPSFRRNLPSQGLVQGTMPAAPTLRVADDTIVYGMCTSGDADRIVDKNC